MLLVSTGIVSSEDVPEDALATSLSKESLSSLCPGALRSSGEEGRGGAERGGGGGEGAWRESGPGRGGGGAHL